MLPDSVCVDELWQEMVDRDESPTSGAEHVVLFRVAVKQTLVSWSTLAHSFLCDIDHRVDCFTHTRLTGHYTLHQLRLLHSTLYTQINPSQ